MTKSLLVEIDDATKDIMFDIQEGLTKNIGDGISNSLDSVIKEQRRNTQELQGLLTSQLAGVSSEITSSKKPMSRLSRDVEDIISLIMKLEKEWKEKIAQLELKQNTQSDLVREQIKVAMNNVFENVETNMTQQIGDVEKKLDDTGERLTNQLNEIELLHSTTAISLEKIERQLKEQIKQLELQQKVQSDLVREQIQAAIKNISEKIVISLNQEFGNVDKKLNDTWEQLTNWLKEIRQTHTATTTNLEETLHMQNKSIENLDGKINEVKKSLTDNSNQKHLLEKLADIEQDLAYQRLPFYKKWFITREDFNEQNND